jgi:hypothetical protein
MFDFIKIEGHLKNLQGLEGWQFAAASMACGWGYREAAAATGLSTMTIMRIERLNVVQVSESGFKEKGMVPPETVEKLLPGFQRAGFKLVPRTETRKPRVESIE